MFFIVFIEKQTKCNHFLARTVLFRKAVVPSSKLLFYASELILFKLFSTCNILTFPCPSSDLEFQKNYGVFIKIVVLYQFC